MISLSLLSKLNKVETIDELIDELKDVIAEILDEYDCGILSEHEERIEKLEAKE